MQTDLPLIIDSFAGGGGASTGIEMALGRSPDVAINHSADALAMHQVNHPETLHLDSNIWDVSPSEVVKGPDGKMRRVGLFWASPDCFPAGTMILTDRGYRAIETIAEGDRVLTHTGRYRRVYATMRAEKAVRRIDVQGVPTITVSDEHPFYARSMHNTWDNTNRRYQRTLAPAAWVVAKDLRAGTAPMNAAGGDRHFCATPCAFEHITIPEVGGRGIALDERLMWLAGRYVGDGWSRLGDGRAELVITCGKLEADGLAERLALWPRAGDRAASSELAWHRRDTKTAHQFSTNHRGLVEWLRDQFGHGGAEKSFPAWALSAPESLRRALLAGYVSADGSQFSTGANHVTETVTISKALALSTKALAESLGFTATVSQPRKNTAVIDGRRVDAKPTYMVRWREAPVRSQTVRDDLHNWSRVQSVGAPGEVVEVFNISVEEDETYIADGIVVHNCKHFSKAKGGKPLDRNIRDLAWVVVRWAEEVKPDVIILENVEEFVTWGPLYEDGRPIVELRGHTFEDWTRRLRRAGYRVQWRELRACDYGAPTIRKRFFMIARRDRMPIVWPRRTHGDPKKPDDAKLIARGLLKPWRTAAEIIDWSIPCPSIFDTAEEILARYGVRAIRPLAEATMRRIARGVVRYVLEAKRPFIVPVAHAGDARVHSVDEPVRTQTGHSRSDHAVVVPVVTYGQQGGGNRDAGQPIHTITASPKDQNAVIVPSLVGCGGRAGQSAPRGGDEPLGTLTAKADGCVVAAHLTKFQSNSTGSGLDEPAPTITANSYVKRPGGAAPIGIVAATMVQTGYGERDGQAPRALDIERPIGTQVGGAAKHAVAAVHLSRFTQNGTGSAADEPVDTVMAGAPKFGVVAAFMAQHNNDSRRIGGVNPGQPADAPVATITATGSQQGIVAAHMMRQFGTSVGHAMDEPAHTDTATVNKSALIAPFLSTYYGNGDGQAADGPLRTDTTKDRFGLVTVEIDGQAWAIADIGMRMLTPRERFRAQGFPDSYIIDRRPDGSPISATVQGSCCGNSVCPPLAAAIVAANCGHLARQREAAE